MPLLLPSPLSLSRATHLPGGRTEPGDQEASAEGSTEPAERRNHRTSLVGAVVREDECNSLPPALLPPVTRDRQGMAEKALEVARSKELRFIPDRFEKVWHGWLGNIHDWCVSRQLWWGHRIPVYYLGELSSFPCPAAGLTWRRPRQIQMGRCSQSHGGQAEGQVSVHSFLPARCFPPVTIATLSGYSSAMASTSWSRTKMCSTLGSGPLSTAASLSLLQQSLLW